MIFLPGSCCPTDSLRRSNSLPAQISEIAPLRHCQENATAISSGWRSGTIPALEAMRHTSRSCSNGIEGGGSMRHPFIRAMAASFFIVACFTASQNAHGQAFVNGSFEANNWSNGANYMPDVD